MYDLKVEENLKNIPNILKNYVNKCNMNSTETCIKEVIMIVVIISVDARSVTMVTNIMFVVIIR